MGLCRKCGRDHGKEADVLMETLMDLFGLDLGGQKKIQVPLFQITVGLAEPGEGLMIVRGESLVEEGVLSEEGQRIAELIRRRAQDAVRQAVEEEDRRITAEGKGAGGNGS